MIFIVGKRSSYILVQRRGNNLRNPKSFQSARYIYVTIRYKIFQIDYNILWLCLFNLFVWFFLQNELGMGLSYKKQITNYILLTMFQRLYYNVVIISVHKIWIVKMTSLLCYRSYHSFGSLTIGRMLQLEISHVLLNSIQIFLELILWKMIKIYFDRACDDVGEYVIRK